MKLGKKGQMAIFIIIGVIIVLGIIIYLFTSNIIEIPGGESEFSEVYNYFEGCIEEETKAALDLAGIQGGRVFNEVYIPGSEYAPFSNQLVIHH